MGRQEGEGGNITRELGNRNRCHRHAALSREAGREGRKEGFVEMEIHSLSQREREREREREGSHDGHNARSAHFLGRP